LSIAASANQTTAFSGEATVVDVKILGNQVVNEGHAGTLPAEGGAEEATLLEYPIAEVPDPLGGALQAEVLHAATVGQGNHSSSEASVANLDLTIAGHTVSADFLMANARAECQGGAASVSGNSKIADLVVDGKPIVGVRFPANYEIDLVDGLVPVGQVIINEQQVLANGSFGDITVNALHVIVFGLADVVISSAHADIICAGPPPPVKDFITGGGWIVASGAKANFAVAGGMKNNGLWGHLSYIDHGQKLKVKGTGVTAYAVTGPTSRHIEGTCEINGVAGTYAVDVADNGEPGSNDTFAIHLSNGYAASGNLAGGNIQLH